MRKAVVVNIRISERDASRLLEAEAADFGHKSVSDMLRRHGTTRKLMLQEIAQRVLDARVERTRERDDAE